MVIHPPFPGRYLRNDRLFQDFEIKVRFPLQNFNRFDHLSCCDYDQRSVEHVFLLSIRRTFSSDTSLGHAARTFVRELEKCIP